MRTILLVEGSTPLRRGISDVLTRNSFNVLQAATGLDALKLLETCPLRVDLCFLNTGQVGTNAAELARSLRAEREGIEVIFFGRSPVCETENFIGEPFDPLDLVAAARGVLERRADERESARA
jgi:DNA-binding response OmpR family regulator